MNRPLISALVILAVGLMTACTHIFPKPDTPPPLPVIEEPKPPLKLKGEYFNSFPWEELAKPMKDGNDPKTLQLYTYKSGDTMQDIAEKFMGNRALAKGLVSYNKLESATDIPDGEKIVIPNPIIGVKSKLLVKHKGEKEFGPPTSFDTELRKGDAYKMKFETNVDGYCYVFRLGVKGVKQLFPEVPKPKKPKNGRRRNRRRPTTTPPAAPKSAKVAAHQPILIPSGDNGIAYNRMSIGDTVYVFLSLRQISDLEEPEGKKITKSDIEDAKLRVKEGEVYSEPPYKLLRITDPTEILGFSIKLRG
ncbi:hypothetical protein ACFL2Q_11735 [Thermodesulfobacteriota bacterium]